MSKSWKTSITSFLTSGSEKELKDSLRDNWFEFYPEDKMAIFHFLNLAKQNKLFLYLFAIDLRNQNIDLPWILFFNVLKESKIKIPDPLFQEILEYLDKQKLVSKKVFTLEQVKKELGLKKRSRFLQRMARHKEELISSAHIAKSERLMDQHLEYMNELKKIAPSEFRIKSLISDQEKRKAEKILRDRLNRRTENEIEFSQAPDAEEKELITKIKQQASHFLDNDKASAVDFAYLFRTLGEPKSAIEFLYKNNDPLKKDWQLLDYLFSGKQYVELLDHCQMLKQKYAEQPDALFSVSYAESISYWKLGEKEKAFDLMQQISSMRPNFKSASETLAQWKEDGLE